MTVKGEDVVQLIAEKIKAYTETPKEARKEAKRQKAKQHWKKRWFGMLPDAIELWRRKP